MGMPADKKYDVTPDGLIYQIQDDGEIFKMARILANNKIELLGDIKVVGNKVARNVDRPPEEAKKDPYNYIDRGSYIELVTPILGISMIQKEYARKKKKHWWSSSLKFSWNEAVNFAQELRLAQFDDWRIPTKEEVKVLHEISILCGISFDKKLQWSSSVQPDRNGILKHVCLCKFGTSGIKTDCLVDNEVKVLLRCVR